jgi:hypothetical protein
VTESARRQQIASHLPERSFSLFPILRSTRPARISFARTILATMLALVLLSGVAPLNTLSRSHQCRMACCVGKSPHAEGSCSVAFATETEEEPAGEQVEEHAAHSHHAHQHAASATSEKIASSDVDAAQQQHPAQHSSSGKKSSRALNVAVLAMTTPCSPACAAAAASASTQLPRPRDAAAMSVAGNPRPPTPARFKKEFSAVLSPSAERRRQLHPRAPPLSLINLSA